MMRFAALTPCTLQDYPGKVACMLFTPGCNFRCGYCHNPEFVREKDLHELRETFLEEHVVLSFLQARRGLLQAVVICGGEPLIHKSLGEFLKKVKTMGFLVKLDTNGSFPEALSVLIHQNLVDYVAMDLKMPCTAYDFCSKDAALSEQLKKSIQLLLSSSVDYEFRSTVLPLLHTQHILKEMGQNIQGAKKWYLQRFQNTHTLQSTFSKEREFTYSEMNQMKEIAKHYVQELSVRM